jgi:hypothetical protein
LVTLPWLSAAAYTNSGYTVADIHVGYYLVPTVLLAIMIGIFVAIPLAAGNRRLRKSGFRQRLAGIPTRELAAVLFPLQHEKHGDARKIAASLIRDLRVTDTELVPAEPTPGSGTEPTPSPPPAV